MKSVRGRIFKSRSILTLLGLIVLVLIVLLAEINKRPMMDTQITSLGTLSSEQQDLEQERQRIEKVLQQNGTANIFVSINSSDWYELFSAPVDINADYVTVNAYRDALHTLADQARVNLLVQIALFNVKIYDGADTFSPGIALTVDQSAFDYMKTLPLIRSMIIDNYAQGTFGDPRMDHPIKSGTIYYTNTPDSKQSGN